MSFELCRHCHRLSQIVADVSPDVTRCHRPVNMSTLTYESSQRWGVIGMLARTQASGNARKTTTHDDHDLSHAQHFFSCDRSPQGLCGHAEDAADDAKDAAAGRLSRPMIAAALQRVHSRLDHLLSPPLRLAGTRRIVSLLPRSMESSIKDLAAAGGEGSGDSPDGKAPSTPITAASTPAANSPTSNKKADDV